MILRLNIFPDHGAREEKDFATYKELMDFAAGKCEQEYKDAHPAEEAEPVDAEKEDEASFPTQDEFAKSQMGEHPSLVSRIAKKITG